MIRNAKEIQYQGFTIKPYQLKGEGAWNGWYAPVYHGADQVGNSAFAYHKKDAVDGAKYNIENFPKKT